MSLNSGAAEGEKKRFFLLHFWHKCRFDSFSPCGAGQNIHLNKGGQVQATSTLAWLVPGLLMKYLVLITLLQRVYIVCCCVWKH